MSTPPEVPIPAPTPPTKPSGVGGLAIAALVVGIVAFFTGLVPVLGIILGAAGVVLGIIALRKGQSKGLSITGLILGAVAFVTSLAITLGLGAIVNVASNTVATATPTASSEPSSAPSEEASAPAPEAEPEWTTVATLTGNADQQSDTIALTGGKVRVKYDFTDASGYGTIVAAVYVLTEGTDVMVDGGIPDVMVSEPGAGETILRKGEGEYYVRVTSANADYTITVEEQK